MRLEQFEEWEKQSNVPTPAHTGHVDSIRCLPELVVMPDPWQVGHASS
jgi:hypothetical protein